MIWFGFDIFENDAMIAQKTRANMVSHPLWLSTNIGQKYTSESGS